MPRSRPSLESTEANIYELVLPALLVAQGVMGAIDALLNHGC